MKYAKIKRKLKKTECYFHREGEKYEIWHSPPLTNSKFTLSVVEPNLLKRSE